MLTDINNVYAIWFRNHIQFSSTTIFWCKVALILSSHYTLIIKQKWLDMFPKFREGLSKIFFKRGLTFRGQTFLGGGGWRMARYVVNYLSLEMSKWPLNQIIQWTLPVTFTNQPFKSNHTFFVPSLQQWGYCCSDKERVCFSRSTTKMYDQ